MSKVKFSALLGAAAILLGAMTGPTIAGGLAVGVQGQLTYIETTGSETLKSNSVVSNAQEGTLGGAPSGFIQYTFGDDGFVLGVEKIPGSITMGDKSADKIDVTGAQNRTDSGATTVKNTAKANIQDHYGVYVETPSLGGLFAKVGYQQATINTDENLGTGASYDDQTATGYSVGIGFRGVSETGLLMKFQAEYADFDDVTFNSTGSDVVTKVNASAETYGIKLSVGYNF